MSDISQTTQVLFPVVSGVRFYTDKIFVITGANYGKISVWTIVAFSIIKQLVIR